MEAFDRLEDPTKNHKKPFALVQSVERRLPFVKSFGKNNCSQNSRPPCPPDIFPETEIRSMKLWREHICLSQVRIYHVDYAEAGKAQASTGEAPAHLMYVCVVHGVTVIGGDANKMAYQKLGQQLNASYSMSTFQFWLEQMENTLDSYLKTKVPGAVSDMNVPQCQSISDLDLQFTISSWSSWRKGWCWPCHPKEDHGCWRLLSIDIFRVWTFHAKEWTSFMMEI